MTSLDISVDIVILSWGRIPDTCAAIDSALEQRGVDPHVYVIDQGTAAEELAILKSHVAGNNRVTLVCNDTNRGVPGGRNQGTALGTAPYVVALDNDKQKGADQKEAFNLIWTDERVRPPNAWPPIGGWRPRVQAYFDATLAAARRLHTAFAIDLGLAEDFFDDKIDRHISMFRVLSYPPQTEAPLPGQLRAGAHSDYGSLTIVLPDDKGLQVFNKAGQWVDVPQVEGGLVVNIADLMMQWTNDQWVSTLHRVSNPPLEVAQTNRRQSLVFFHQPNYDAMVECLPSCLAPGEKPKYAPISSGDHLTSKFVKQTTFGGTKATA